MFLYYNRDLGCKWKSYIGPYKDDFTKEGLEVLYTKFTLRAFSKNLQSYRCEASRAFCTRSKERRDEGSKLMTSFMHGS